MGSTVGCWLPNVWRRRRGNLHAMSPPIHITTRCDCGKNSCQASSSKLWCIRHLVILAEVGGGSIRIHNAEMQTAVFGILGIEEEHKSSASLLDALQCDITPPHAGLAFGLDRRNATGGTENHRDVIAFPKTTAAAWSTNRRAKSWQTLHHWKS